MQILLERGYGISKEDFDKQIRANRGKFPAHEFAELAYEHSIKEMREGTREDIAAAKVRYEAMLRQGETPQPVPPPAPQEPPKPAPVPTQQTPSPAVRAEPRNDAL